MKFLRSIIIIVLALFAALPLSAAIDARADLLFNRADSLLQDGLIQEAIETGLEAEESALKSDDTATLVKVWCTMGEAYLQLGDTENAQKYYRQCINIPQVQMDVSTICNTLLHIAQSYRRIGNYPVAESYAILSLDISEGLDGRSGNTALRYLELGKLYVDMGRLGQALETLDKGLEVISATSNHVVKARLLICRGYSLELAGQKDKALSCYYDAANELESSDNGGGRFGAVCCYRIASVLRARGENDKAQGYYLKALEHTNWAQDHTTEMNLYRDYSTFLESTDLDLSKAYAAKADSLSYVTYLDQFSSRMAVNSLQILLKDQEEAISLKDQMLDLQRKRQTLLILLIIALVLILLGTFLSIHKKNQDNAELQRRDFVNNRMFSVISHDLRAPAIARRTALHMLADSPSLNSEDFNKVCSDLAFQSDSEVVMLDNLLQWARFQSMNPDSVIVVRFDVVDAVQEATSQLLQYAKQKSINIESHSSEDPMFLCSNRNMLIIVIRNLLANAIKFSHRDSTVKIEMTGINDGTQIIVTDEGVGMSSKMVDDINSNLTPGNRRLGTENETGTGMGLVLCRDVLRLCGGTLRVESEEGKGSKFIVNIKNK